MTQFYIEIWYYQDLWINSETMRKTVEWIFTLGRHWPVGNCRWSFGPSVWLSIHPSVRLSVWPSRTTFPLLLFKDYDYQPEIWWHYHDVTMGTMASQITSLTIVYSVVYSGTDQRKHQSSTSLAIVWGIHKGPVNSLHKWPGTRKMFPFDDAIMDDALYHAAYRYLKWSCSANFCVLHSTSKFSMIGFFDQVWGTTFLV